MTERTQDYVRDDGRTFHAGPDGSEHVGPWLHCDTCNPVQLVVVREGHAIADLRAEYAEAKAEEAKVAERVKAATAKLKAAQSEASGGAYRSSLHVPGFKPLNLTYSEGWTLDSKALKAKDPETWVIYAKQSGRWTLAESKAADS